LEKPNQPAALFMIQDYQNMTMEELVDILAQKTQKITQLLVEKKFDDEYKQCKEDIQQILAQIELKKESDQTDAHLKINGPGTAT
jgi:hypothetical protein